jgi:hypothetical protein
MKLAADMGRHSGRATPSLHDDPYRQFKTATGRPSTYPLPIPVQINSATSDPYFLYAVMHSRRAQSMFKDIATPGVSQSNINPTNLKKQIIPLPDVREQRQIAAQLQSVEAGWRAALDELTTQVDIKITLMSDLLSGHVRVPA